MLAAAGILGRFIDFLIVLGVAFPPIAGIMVAEYFVVKRWRGELDASRRFGHPASQPPRASSRPPSSSGRCSAVIGYFVTWGIPPLISLLLSMVLYIVAGKLGLVQRRGESRTLQAEPSTVSHRSLKPTTRYR